MRIESRIVRTIRNRIESWSFAGPSLLYSFCTSVYIRQFSIFSCQWL